MNASSAITCSPAADDQFGPAIYGCRDDFDFTLTFEQCFFSIVPAAALLIVAPFRIRHLSALPKAVRGTLLRYIKLAVISLWSICQLVSLILWAVRSGSGTLKSTALAASCLSFLASLAACALSYTEHTKSIRPSTLFTTYLFISLILDAATLRSIWLSGLPATFRALSTTSFVLKATVIFLEAKEKRGWLVESKEKYSPEETSGVFNRGVFWWVNSLLLSGFRQLLQPEDLFPIHGNMSAAMLNNKFSDIWKHDTRDSKYKLIKGASETHNVGYGLIAAYGLVYVGMAISSAFYCHKAFRMATMLRGLLITAVFRKTTEINIAASDNSASVTLMSTDVDTIVRAMRQVHDLWADVIQVAIATWLLSIFIGPAAAAPVVVCLLSLVLTIYVSPMAKASQGAWFSKVQKRVGITSKMLGHMKSIKMSGLAQKLASSISQMRREEIQAARPFRMIMVSTAALAQVPVLLSPVAAFAVFAGVAAKTGETFQATTLFSSLSLIILLAAPLFGTFETIVNLQSSMACFDRIQKYLSEPTRQDRRERLLRSPASLSSSREPHMEADVKANASNGIELAHALRQLASGLPAQPSSFHVHLEDSCFGWSKDEPCIVKNVNVAVMESQMLVVVGQVASGKSTLLKGLLGECPVVTGNVRISQVRTSWCDQTPWIQNRSIRKNIVGYGHFDSVLYTQVIQACDLQKDLAGFPEGDDTIVGSKGVALSGGQKQRVALARAIYTRPEIAIFDDILSGLDNHTANNICKRLFGIKDGILRKWGTTVILATQSAIPLSMADQIMTLGKDGTVIELGSFAELTRREGYVSSIYQSSQRGIGDDGTFDDPKDDESINAPKDGPLAGKPGPDDKRRQLGDNTVYLFYFSALGPVFTAILLAVEFSNAFLQTFPTVWLKWWSDASDADGNQRTGLYLGVYAGLQVAAIIAFFVLTWFVIVKVVAKSGLELHERLLRVVVRAPLSLFTSNDTGSLTTRFSQDIGEVDRNLPLGMLVTIQNLLTCIGQAVLIASSTWYLAIAYPFLIAAFFFLQQAYLRTSRQLRFLDLDEKAPVYTQFIETLAGLSTIRAFGWTQPAIDQNHDLVDRAQKPFYLLLMIQRWLTLVLDLIVAALALLVVGLAVRLRESVSVGLTGVSLVQLITFAETVRMLILWWTSLETSIGAVARIKQFSENTPDEDLLGEGNIPPQNWPSQGAIELQGICATYDTGNDNKALDRISISIKGGEKVAIVGRTGSGKSSLLLTLTRMLDLSSGSITIDDLDISMLSRDLVRSQLTAITQDQFFLPGTVRQNIDPYEASSVEDIIDALSKVEIWASIEQKGGLDVDMGEGMLSHGQRQLFFLARAILRKNSGRVVLLDEATSRQVLSLHFYRWGLVDHHTEARIRDLIRTEFSAHTVIAIAHRLDTIADFDRVVVLEKGFVVDQGRPADLLQRAGPFKMLWDAARGTSAM
ncbi:putative P-loop containing nucleoside triphosphate hydrolase protein [Seiridium cardinale]|uniref:P-loop containing nucleoside triphosphate hydrolase protein n=1 Tax=Seiridium cardinale TaxID=138064 RepID=A0ABR2XSN8_9PEZI